MQRFPAAQLTRVRTLASMSCIGVPLLISTSHGAQAHPRASVEPHVLVNIFGLTRALALAARHPAPALSPSISLSPSLALSFLPSKKKLGTGLFKLKGYKKKDIYNLAPFFVRLCFALNYFKKPCNWLAKHHHHRHEENSFGNFCSISLSCSPRFCQCCSCSCCRTRPRRSQ